MKKLNNTEAESEKKTLPIKKAYNIIAQTFGVATSNLSFFLFFSIWIFFHNHSRTTVLQGQGEGISLTPHYHFHPTQRHLDISPVITAESSPLYIGGSKKSNREPLVSERKSLTTQLSALKTWTAKSYVNKPSFERNIEAVFHGWQRMHSNNI